MAVTEETHNLLVLEDDLSEQKLIKLMVEKSGHSLAIRFINNGEDAVNYINDYPISETVFTKIHLILLDLNMPKINGINILKTLKLNNHLHKIPVVVLTTSNNKNDINQAYDAGASGFVIKPNVIDEYENVIKQVFDYWFGICLLP